MVARLNTLKTTDRILQGMDSQQILKEAKRRLLDEIKSKAERMARIKARLDAQVTPAKKKRKIH